MSQVITTHSFGRAAGRSTLTANLAGLLAQAGHRVGVIETDFQAPSMHLFFGLEESNIHCTLNHYLWEQCPVYEIAYDVTPPVSIPQPGCVILVPASSDISDIMRMVHESHPVEPINDAIQYLSEKLELDTIFLDTSAGLSEETIVAAALSNTLVVLLRPDAQDYQGTAVAVEIARELDVPHLLLVLNSAPETLDIEQARRELEQCYECEVGVVLPYSPEVQATSSSGLVVYEYPDCDFTHRLQHLASRITGKE